MNLCTQAQNHTQINVPCIVNHFLENPNISRQKLYSCDEFIAFCLLIMKINTHLLVPSFRQGCLIDKPNCEAKLTALIKVMDKKISSRSPKKLVELQQEYEYEKILLEEELVKLKQKDEQMNSKIEKEIELNVLKECLLYIDYYKDYYNLKTGTGTIRRVRSDQTEFLASIAIERGLEWNARKMLNEFDFWAKHKFPYMN